MTLMEKFDNASDVVKDDNNGSLNASQVAITVVCSLLALVNIVGNLLIILCIKTDQRFRTPSYLYITSLAVADVSVGVIVMPLFVVYEVLGYWPFSQVTCDFWIVMDFTCSSSSIFTLCAISFDRYLATARPFKYKHEQTRKRALVIIFCTWALPFICWSPAVIYFRTAIAVPQIEKECMYLPPPLYVLSVSIIIYYIPMVVVVCIYIRVVQSINKHVKAVGPHVSTNAWTSKNAEFPFEEFSTDTQSIKTQNDRTLQLQSRGRVTQGEPYINKKGSMHETVDTGAGREVKLCTGPGQGSPKPTPSNHSKTTQSEEKRSIETQRFNDIGSRENDHELMTPTTQQHGQNRVNGYKNRERSKIAMQRRLAITLGIIVVAFLVCWLPFVILFPVNGYCECVPTRLYNASYWLAYINSTLNPYLCLFSNRDIRNALGKMFHLKR
ncbi:muscarinic acetylcholine receptor M4-like [Glandiceps talaboti]